MLGVYWHTKFVCLVFPDCAAGWVIIIVDRVIEVHDALLAVPVKTIGQLHPFWTQQLQIEHRDKCQLRCTVVVQSNWVIQLIGQSQKVCKGIGGNRAVSHICPMNIATNLHQTAISNLACKHVHEATSATCVMNAVDRGTLPGICLLACKATVYTQEG